MGSRFYHWLERSPRNSVTFGIILMLTAFFLFSMANGVVKYLSTTYSIAQILFVRGLFFCLFSVPLLLLDQPKKTFRQMVNPPQKKILFLRGALVALSLWGLFYGFKVLPLANATVLCFSEIFFMSLIAIPMLKESITKKQWFAMVLGFGGVVIAVKPSSELFSLAHIGPIIITIAAFLDGLVMIYPRKLVKYMSANTIMFYYSFYALPFIGLLLCFDWGPLDISLTNAGWFLTQATLSFIGQVAATYAFRYAPTGTLAPMIFSALIWGTLFGFLFWGEVPDLATLLGGGLIIMAGFYIIRHERKAMQEKLENPLYAGNP